MQNRKNKAKYSRLVFSRLAFKLLLVSCIAFVAGCSDQTRDEPVRDPQTAIPIKISCSPDAQTEFANLITLLHSFEYVETMKRFDAVIADEPTCAMAYWGKAMSIWHPLWAPPSKAHLDQGMQLLAQTDGLTKSAKEQALIDALKSFYASTDLTTNKQRARDYADAMAKISSDYPDDYEIEIFYALGLLGAANLRDKTYVNQHKAGEILKKLEADHPLHPGVLHYNIHAYDYPGLAYNALEEAKIYANSAKNSAHAQHMPSHIFTRLGMWERSLSSNHDSTKSATDYTQRANLSGYYDEGLHSIDYLMYAMLQTGRDAEAKQLLARLGNIKKTNTENFKVAFAYAAAPARYVLERRAWEEASQLELMRPDFLWEDFGWARSMHVFARGLGAARSGKIGQARTELADIAHIQSGLSKTLMLYLSTEVQVQYDVVKSWILLAEGDVSAAIDLAKTAAILEDSLDKHPVTPGEVLPARELYADMLFETGNYSEALLQYKTVLAGAPKRLNALIGAAQSAAKMGDMETAKLFADIVHEQTKFGDRSIEMFDPQ